MPDTSSLSSPSPFLPFLPTLRTGRWFAQLPADFAHGLLSMARLRTLQPGEALFLRNSAPCGLYAVVRGSMRISGQSGVRDDAREAVLILLPPPNWFGEISVFDGSARTHDAHAAEASTLLHIPHDVLLRWLQQNPQHWRDLALLMADKLRRAFVSMEEQTILPAPIRLARRLVMMAQGYDQGMAQQHSRRSMALTQEQLALMVGISRQTTNQILKDLKERQMIRLQRGTLEILDLDALRSFCL